jgi:hypothetical protein
MPYKFTACRICGGERIKKAPYCYQHFRERERAWGLQYHRSCGVQPLEEYRAAKTAAKASAEELRRRDRERKKASARAKKPKKRKPVCEAAAEAEKLSFIDSLMAKYRRLEPVGEWGR